MTLAAIPRAILLLCLGLASSVGQAATATPQAETNDIIVLSTPSAPSHGSDILIYSSEGKLRTSLHLNVSVGDGQASLGISGSAEYVFFNTIRGDTDGTLAIVRVAGGKPKYMGSFSGGKNLQFGGIASGDVSADGDAFVYVGQAPSNKGCKPGKGKDAIETGMAGPSQIVQLRFTPGRNGSKSVLKRGKIFAATPSTGCNVRLAAVYMLRTIGNKLYAVLQEAEGGYTLRSYDAFKSKPKMSKPIVSYGSPRFAGIFDVTIDSPTSFAGTDFDNEGDFRNIQIRIEKGKKPFYGPPTPGKSKGKVFPLFGGGDSSYTDGKGIIRATGIIAEADFIDGGLPTGNSIYKFNAKTLGNPRKLFTLKATDTSRALLVVSKPRQL